MRMKRKFHPTRSIGPRKKGAERSAMCHFIHMNAVETLDVLKLPMCLWRVIAVLRATQRNQSRRNIDGWRWPNTVRKSRISHQFRPNSLLSDFGRISTRRTIQFVRIRLWLNCERKKERQRQPQRNRKKNTQTERGKKKKEENAERVRKIVTV